MEVAADTPEEVMDGDQALLFALYTLIKLYGKNDRLRWEVPQDLPMPKEGMWTFSTEGFEGKYIEVVLYEGKDILEIQRGPESTAKEIKPDAVWAEWLGEEPFSGDFTQPGNLEHTGDGDNVHNGVPEHPDSTSGE